MKVFFLLNPSRADRVWDYREAAGAAARRAGATARFGQIDRTNPNSAERLLTQGFEEGCRRVVAVGGDGTINRTVNVMHKLGRLASTELAVVPAGTCNDFVRTLGLSPRRLPEAFDAACRGTVRAADVGSMNGRLFLNNAGFGRRSPVSDRQRSRALRTLRSFSPTPLRAQWDKGTMEGSFFMVLACNAPYFSSGLHFSRNPRPHDGWLDVFFVSAMPKWRLLPLLAAGRMGRPLKSRRVISLRVHALQVDADADLWPQADGEPPVGAVRRVSFGLLPEKAMIVVPKSPRAALFWNP